MPAELLEKPVETEKQSQDTLNRVTNATPKSRNQEFTAQAPKSLLRRIFEGREEFLGCTPD
jgi:hypothetical protein